MALICQIISTALKGLLRDTEVISVDEKTGIQALGRKNPTLKMKPGKPRRIESEYQRHGTTTLMAAYDVIKGILLYHWINPTRKEPDFLYFIQQLCARISPKKKIIILLDQLNTHMSESLVKWVAQEEGFQGDLGKKAYKGILKNMKSRKAFLEDPTHRIRFVFTPKHCSWLNPVENWFSKLQRQVIKYGEFKSIKELENRIHAYVEFYNKVLAKPINWKFKGFSKGTPLNGMKLQA